MTHHLGQIDHLVDEGGGVVAAQVGVAAVAARRLVIDRPVGREDRVVVLRVSRLGASAALARLTRDAPLELLAIGRRGPGGVRGILPELGLEFGDACGEGDDRCRNSGGKGLEMTDV